jgi:hypothetical protein
VAWRHQTGLPAPFQTWNLHSLYLQFPWFYAVIGHTKTSIRMLHFLEYVYVCAFHPIPSLHIQNEHWLVCCCHFKYLQLEVKKKKTDFQLQFPLSSITYLYAYNSVASRSCQQSRADVSNRSQACVMTSHFWCELSVTTTFACLLNHCVSVDFCIYCKLNWQTVLFSGYASVWVTAYCIPFVSAVSQVHCRLNYKTLLIYCCDSFFMMMSEQRRESIPHSRRNGTF